jgi:membrane-bound serine protease (ClpP class)
VGRRLVLDTVLGGPTTAAPEPPGDQRWLGQRGTTTSPLRPAGVAEFDGERIDVVSRGEYVDAGEPIEVVRVEGNRIVVRPVRGPREA